MSENLRIQLLGRFEVWRDGAPIPPAEWRGQKPRDLLKILLLARGRLVSNDLGPAHRNELLSVARRAAAGDRGVLGRSGE